MPEGVRPETRRFAFVGNMNNMPFLYAREMHQRGVDVVLYLDSPADYQLDRPESIDPSVGPPFPTWIREIAVPRISHFIKRLTPKTSYRKLLDELNGYDVVILNGNWITLAPFLSDKISTFALCSGYEIDVLCDLDNIDTFLATPSIQTFVNQVRRVVQIGSVAESLVRILLRRRIRLQRRGVQRCVGISYYTTGISPRGDALIGQLMKGRSYKRLEVRGFPTDYPEYREPSAGGEPFRILNFTRFSFFIDLLDDKRNDVMIRGIGLFRKEVGHVAKVEVLFFEKGIPESLAAAKKMILDEGFEDWVTWHDPVSFRELFGKFVPDCDVAFDQFGKQWMGAGLYAMLVGRPVIANERPDIFRNVFAEDSPVCQAKTPEEVCSWLVKLYRDRDLIRQVGQASRQYVVRNFDIGKTLEFFMEQSQVAGSEAGH